MTEKEQSNKENKELLAKQKNKEYGSTKQEEKKDIMEEDNALIKKTTQTTNIVASMSRIPITLGLNNPEFRASVFGILLFTWIVPSFVNKIMDRVNNNCNLPSCDLWIVSYCIALGAMGFYELTFICLWYKNFSGAIYESQLVVMLKKCCALLLFVSAVLFIISISYELKHVCPKNNTNHHFCKIGYFGIYFVPILTILHLSIDIFMPQFANHSIRLRCIVLSGIIFIASLLIVISIFGDMDYYFNTSINRVYSIGWLLTCVASFLIHIFMVSGIINMIKSKHLQLFYAMDYFAFCVLVSGISLTMVNINGYIDISRIGFIIFAEVSIVSIEMFLI